MGILNQPSRQAACLAVWLYLLALSGSAQTLEIPAHGLLRLPATLDSMRLEKLQMGAGAQLLVPASVQGLDVTTLRMGSGARIRIAPRSQVFSLRIQRGIFADGSQISARGTDGDEGVPGGRGTDLQLHITSGNIENLRLDTRGGHGGQGWSGDAGEQGRNAACWGRGARPGSPGGNGGNGQPGGDGGNILLSVPHPDWLELIDLLLEGGHGGAAGAAGSGGTGGQAASCWIYSLGAAADNGARGHAGQPAREGRPGIFRLQ